MNKSDISREKIIEVFIELLKNSNKPNLNMRDLAKTCEMSVGSIYNYFPTKSDLMIAVIEDVWRGVFHSDIFKTDEHTLFTHYISEIYSRAYNTQKEYHNFFIMHRNMITLDAKIQGRDVMTNYIRNVKLGLVEKLNLDKSINNSIWKKEFTKESLVDFIFDNMILMLSQGKDKCGFLIILLNKILSGDCSLEQSN